VFTADEGDHFTGAAPNNPDCTGATIDNTQDPPVVTPGNYCTYPKTPYNPTSPPGPPFGEVTVGLEGVLAAEQNVTATQFTVGNDTAPGVYIDGTSAPRRRPMPTYAPSSVPQGYSRSPTRCRTRSSRSRSTWPIRRS
jgi:hypothetical protein